MTYSIRPVKFGGYKNHKEKEKFEKIILDKSRLEQANIDYIAQQRAVQKTNNDLSKGAMAAVGADIFVSGASTPGQLAAKTAGAATSAGAWGRAIGSWIIYDSVVRKVADNNDSLKEAQREHPIATTFLYLMGGIASITGFEKLYSSAKSLIAKKYPKQVESFKNCISSAKTAIDKSWVNTEIAKPVAELSKKVSQEMPTITSAVKAVAPYAPYLILGGTLISAAMNADKKYQNERAKVEKEYNAAKEKVLLRKSIEKIMELDKKSNKLFYLTKDLSKKQSVMNARLAELSDDDEDDD